MLNPPSPDISKLSAEVLWDISGSLPSIVVTSKLEGDNLSAVSVWFVASSPSGTLIFEGAENSPNTTGTFTSYTISSPWPRPFNNIEFGASPYELTIYAKDSVGNIYSETYSVSLCRPFGNTEKSTNPYGLAETDVSVKCEQGRVFFRNQTNVSYKGVKGTMTQSALKVFYPVDETNTQPPPFQITNFSTALVPISYSSENYQFVTEQYYLYDMGGGVFVKIRYQQKATFAVYCNIDLYPLICEYKRLLNQLETGNCVDAQEANQTLLIVNSKMSLVFMGMMQPLLGIKVPDVIKEIEAIGGFECNCCSAPTGIIPSGSSVIDGYNFSFNKLGGDVNGSFSQVGSNIVLNLSDVSYVFNISNSTLSQTSAFSVSNSTSGDGFTKTYSLNVDLGVLGTDLATTISNNGTLLNLWKTVLGIGGGASIIVDGGCIFMSRPTCDYYFTLSNIPSSGSYALLSSIVVGGVSNTTSYAFNLTNLSGLQGYLNSLGYGSWTVTNLGGGVVQVSTLSNSSDIGGLNYSVAATLYSAELARECSGYIPITLDQFAAYIVNYLCQLNDSNIKTASAYEVCYIDGNGQIQTVQFASGVSLQAVMLSLTERNCDTISYIKGLGAVTCDSIKSVFPTNSSLSITGTDFVLGTKGNGVCSRVSYLDSFRYVLQAAKSDAYTRNLFCELVTMCGAGLACSPFSYFEVLVTNYDTLCVEAVGLEYSFS